jgi:hypothetical protein
MSSKQAKRERKAQRLRGEVPHLDAKRADANSRYEADMRQREADLKFRREHPAKWAEQQRVSREKVLVLLSALTSVMGGVM